MADKLPDDLPEPGPASGQVSEGTARALENWRAMTPSEQLGRLAAPGDPYEAAPSTRMIDLEVARMLDALIGKTVEAQLYTENETAGLPAGLFSVRTGYSIAHTGARLLDVVTHAIDPQMRRASRMHPIRYYEGATQADGSIPAAQRPRLQLADECAWEVMQGDTKAGKVCVTACGQLMPVEMAAGIIEFADKSTGNTGDRHTIQVNYCPSCGSPVGGSAVANSFKIFRPGDVKDLRGDGS
jgi:hypothetical protein